MLEKCWEYNVSVYLTYRDFRQAYDSVRREKIYEALQHFQIPSKLLRLVKVPVDNTVANVQVQTEMMELFEIRGGWKRGGGWPGTTAV
jgi:hypothetical protein